MPAKTKLRMPYRLHFNGGRIPKNGHRKRVSIALDRDYEVTSIAVIKGRLPVHVAFEKTLPGEKTATPCNGQITFGHGSDTMPSATAWPLRRGTKLTVVFKSLWRRPTRCEIILDGWMVL
jgi:hypothetical protein